VNLAVEKYEYH